MAPILTTLPALIDGLVDARNRCDPSRALLVGLSGIDGSGKGWTAARLTAALEARNLRVALLNVDGWLNLPHVRFADHSKAEHFYEHALRLDAFVATLLQPLQATRSVDLVMEFAEETATTFRPQRYQFDDVDVVLAEGIYLFKRHLRPVFDVAVWLECPFKTALERAIRRGQEGLSPDATITAYQTIYFPAQERHFRLDQPREWADYVLLNDA